MIMKSMQIFEPAMCCDTGLCGVGVDPELLRISTVLNSLSKNGVTVERFNLSSAPQVFVTNKVVNDFIKTKSVDELPLITFDGEIIITGRYPTNDEFVTLLNIPQSYLGEQKIVQELADESEGCCCSGGGCC
jgi:hypothetical protein